MADTLEVSAGGLAAGDVLVGFAGGRSLVYRVVEVDLPARGFTGRVAAGVRVDTEVGSLLLYARDRVTVAA